MKHIGFIKRKGQNKKNLPSLFKEEDFNNRTPIIETELRLIGVNDQEMIFVDEYVGLNAIIHVNHFIYHTKKSVKNNNVFAHGIFAVHFDGVWNKITLVPTNNLEELKAQGKFYKNDIDFLFKEKALENSLDWIKLSLPKTITNEDGTEYDTNRIFTETNLKLLKGKIAIIKIDDSNPYVDTIIFRKKNSKEYAINFSKQLKIDYNKLITDSTIKK